jgi:hypothetical protein
LVSTHDKTLFADVSNTKYCVFVELSFRVKLYPPPNSLLTTTLEIDNGDTPYSVKPNDVAAVIPSSIVPF